MCALCDGVPGSPHLYADDLSSPSKPRIAQPITEESSEYWWRPLRVAQTLARDRGIDIDGEGYMLVTNVGRHGSRSFPHLHVHLMSGSSLV
jgi:diadenosine tetraphosphate (Ap4A) HIT family hydrolase